MPELRFTERSTTIIGSQGGVQLLQCITDYKGVVSSQADGEEPVGFALVPELQEMMCAGIELQNVKKIRG
jgi:hypothetical protein